MEWDGMGWNAILSRDGATLAVSAPFHDGPTNTEDARGLVRVFEWDSVNEQWQQKGSDIGGEATGDVFGGALALSSDGSIIAVGATRNDGNGTNSGHVRVFEWLNNVWEQKGADIDGTVAYDWTGYAVALSNDGLTLALSDPLNDSSGGTDSGACACLNG